jgi:hypothetical protein
MANTAVVGEDIPQGLKPATFFAAFAARLKSCPFKTQDRPQRDGMIAAICGGRGGESRRPSRTAGIDADSFPGSTRVYFHRLPLGAVWAGRWCGRGASGVGENPRSLRRGGRGTPSASSGQAWAPSLTAGKERGDRATCLFESEEEFRVIPEIRSYGPRKRSIRRCSFPASFS